ncbi:hypothetical protein [Nitrosomonas europaea]|uniref:hypothetical protein n=1 Tax=Nitrosomonas europaea TaxID=915 RepID=UPI000799D28B|nr:hypothetical protein [Nitrosomonas europaea]KXK50276.1 MAG: hypothetical protein UZ02_AOB001000116 [Nitrosomonas europaea]
MQPRVSITLCCIVLGIVIHSVPAATVIAADHHPDQIQTRNTTIHYDIPAGSLIDALSRFARQSGRGDIDKSRPAQGVTDTRPDRQL